MIGAGRAFSEKHRLNYSSYKYKSTRMNKRLWQQEGTLPKAVTAVLFPVFSVLLNEVSRQKRYRFPMLLNVSYSYTSCCPTAYWPHAGVFESKRNSNNKYFPLRVCLPKFFLDSGRISFTRGWFDGGKPILRIRG